MVFHLNLHFLDDICRASSYMLICQLYILFGEVSVMVFGPFFSRVILFLLSFKSYFYLDNDLLSVVFFADFFSQSGLSSHFLTLSFAEPKFLISIKSCLSVISFIDRIFDVVSKKSLSYPRSFRFSYENYVIF